MRPHRDPPPYPGPGAGCTLYQPGFRESFSGSETSTDMSLSSTESLCCPRQEPQGQETLRPFPNTIDPNVNGSSSYSILGRLGLTPATAVEVKATNSSTFYVTGSLDRQDQVIGDRQGQAFCDRQDRDKQNLVFSDRQDRALDDIQGQDSQCYIHAFHRVAVDSSSTQTKVVCALSASQVAAQCIQTSDMLPVQRRSSDIGDPEYSVSAMSNQPNEAKEETNLLMRWHQLQQSHNAQGASKTTQMFTRKRRSSKIPVSQSHKQHDTKKFIDSSLPRSLTSATQLEEWGMQVVNGTAMSPPANENWRQLDAAVSAQHMTLPSTLPNVLPSHVTSNQRELTNEVERPRPATAPISGRHARLDVQLSGHHDVLIRGGQLLRSYERIDRSMLTHSQPDLTRLAKLQLAPSMGMMRHNDRVGSVESGGSLSFDELTAIGDSLVMKRPTELDHAAIATRATQMVERLSGENRELRSELDGYYKKVCKLQKFEMEIEKVRNGYEDLVKQSQRREHLEKLMRYKLEAEIKKLRGMNTELQEDLNQALSQLLHSERNNLTDTEVTKELRRKDSLLSKLITQNQDVLAVKERLQLEVARQRSTVQELRTHIDVLSEALTSARSSTLKYEEEIQRRHTQEQKVDDLQKTLLQMKLVSEKREIVQQQIRHKLEQEVELLKEHKANRNRVAMETDEGIASDSESPTSVQSLIRQVHDREQRVLNLQAEVVKIYHDFELNRAVEYTQCLLGDTSLEGPPIQKLTSLHPLSEAFERNIKVFTYKWEQKFLEESISKQLAVETAAVTNREAHLSAAASVAVECGRISCENTHDAPVRFLQEIYAADHKCAIYEAKLKSLQRHLEEKDAVMRMMGGHTSLDEAAGHFYASPHHSKHPSISSLSSLTATPPSSCSSRQSSQVDVSRRYTLLRPDPRPPAHSKSNSLGSSLTSDGEGENSHCLSEDPQLRFLQRNFPAQVALRGSLQSGCDQLKECFWQV